MIKFQFQKHFYSISFKGVTERSKAHATIGKILIGVQMIPSHSSWSINECLKEGHEFLIEKQEFSKKNY